MRRMFAAESRSIYGLLESALGALKPLLEVLEGWLLPRELGKGSRTAVSRPPACTTRRVLARHLRVDGQRAQRRTLGVTFGATN